MQNEPNYPLNLQQEYVRDFIIQNPYVGIYLNMGFGKTLTTIAALTRLPPVHTLIIAPKAVARATWQAEMDKWHAPFKTKSLFIDPKTDKVFKKPALRHQVYDEVVTDPPMVYFISKDYVYELVNYFLTKYNNQWPFQYVVLDESHKFKSYKSKQRLALRKVRPAMTRLVELTGTPMTHGLMDLWGQIDLLDQGEHLGPNITAYRNTFFKATKYFNDHPVAWEPLKTPNYDAKQDIFNRIKGFTIYMEKDNTNLPNLTYVNDTVKLDQAERQAYDQIFKDQILEPDSQPLYNTNGERTTSDNIAVTADTRALLQMKLMQIANGAVYIDDYDKTTINYRPKNLKAKDKKYIVIHNQKLNELMRLINEINDNIIITYNFQSDLLRIKERLDKEKLAYTVFDGSKQQQEDWNAGKIHLLLFQPSSNSAGINMQFGGHTIIWFSLTWNLEQYKQTNARLYRQGQTHDVTIHHIMIANTVDQQIIRRLKKNDASEESLFQAIKVTISQQIKKGTHNEQNQS